MKYHRKRIREIREGQETDKREREGRQEKYISKSAHTGDGGTEGGGECAYVRA